MLPSILSDLEQRCLIVELNERIFGGKLDEEHVRTALMTPSASVGLDYNRCARTQKRFESSLRPVFRLPSLELLGDAFLKYMSSTYCYVSHERTTHEGILHRARLEQINNHRFASVDLFAPVLVLTSVPRSLYEAVSFMKTF